MAPKQHRLARRRYAMAAPPSGGTTMNSSAGQLPLSAVHNVLVPDTLGESTCRLENALAVKPLFSAVYSKLPKLATELAQPDVPPKISSQRAAVVRPEYIGFAAR